MHIFVLLNKYKLSIVFLLLFLYKLSLIGTGACSLGDENRYWHAFHGFFELFHGRWQSACHYFFTLGGRPLLAFVHLPQFLTQALLYYLFDMDPRSVQSLYFVQLINIAYNLILIYCFYLLLLKWTHCSSKIALLACILYGLLLDNNLYLRHLFPYDITLALWIILYLYIDLIKNNIFIGAFIVFITLAYPAYWPMALLALLLRFYYLNKLSYNSIFHSLFKLFLGSILSIVIVFVISYFSGNSLLQEFSDAGNAYVNDLKLPYDGSVRIYFSYLIGMDSIVGIILIIFTLIGFVLSTKKIFSKIQITPIEIIIIALFLSFTMISLLGNYLDQKLMYGRMLKQFTPLLIIISIYVLHYISSQIRFANTLLSIILIAVIFQASKFWFEFKQVFYPRDVFSEYVETSSSPSDFNNYDLADNIKMDSLKRTDEFEPQLYYSVPPQSLGKRSSMKDLIFVNFELPVFIKPKLSHEIHSENSKLIFSGEHFYTYYPYSFDWIPFADPELSNLNLKMKIYEK